MKVTRCEKGNIVWFHSCKDQNQAQLENRITIALVGENWLESSMRRVSGGAGYAGFYVVGTDYVDVLCENSPSCAPVISVLFCM